jgi:hypothetical protein
VAARHLSGTAGDRGFDQRATASLDSIYLLAMKANDDDGYRALREQPSRRVIVGAAAAGVTYGFGKLIGVSPS